MNDELNYELLDDVAHVIMGQSPPSSTYNTVGKGLPFYQGKTDFGDMYPTPRVYCTEPSRIAESGDILISVRAPVGPTNLSRERSCIGRGISAIRVGGKLERDFLLYFLRFYEPELAKAGTGSTFTAISREDLETIKIPLPPLIEQKRIASLLRRADRLCQLRREAHDLGDALFKSMFLEMFGDLKFPEAPLSELCNFITKGTTPQSSDIKDQATNSSDVPFLKVYHIVDNGRIDFDYSPSFVSKPIHEGLLNRSKAYPNDVLMNIVGPPLGKIGIVPSSYPEWNVNQAIAIFRAKEKIKPIYLLHALKYPKILDKLLQQAVGIRQLNLSLEQCRDFRIPVPPLSLQEEFAGVVAQVEGLRGRMSEAERQVNELFESLLSESFGE